MEPLAAGAVAQESSVLRYYTSQLLLRVLASDAYDPDGASFAPTADAAFLSLAESRFVGPLLLRAPSVVVVPASPQDTSCTRGVFTVLPAEGFVKEPGEPVYYNDPIQLVDQRGRVLGIVNRAPFSGHLAADGHSGALVFVMERHTSRLQAIGNKFLRRSLSHQSTVSSEGSDNGSSDSGHRSSIVGRTAPRRSSLVQVCGGERLRIPGLARVVKKQYPGGCIMQPKLDDSSRSSRKSMGDERPPYLTCEIVLTSQPALLTRSESSSSTICAPCSTGKKAAVADRTATGEFVGVLHSGVLHRRSDHMKLWKKRFFVLTQVALHRFNVTETLQTVRTQKARGSIFLKDCRGVRYERFSKPHEIEIELNTGKVFSLHAVDALTCAEWASVLSRAIENPHWVHAEQSYLTVWRSDYQFESPQCPAITKVVLGSSKGKFLDSSIKTITTFPHWNEKLSLGSITTNGFLLVQLADGNVFRLTLEDLTRSLLQPHWIAVSASLDVARIQALEDGNVPDRLSEHVALRKSETQLDGKPDKSQFLIRLKFRADLQLDERLTQRRPYEFERRVVVGVMSSLVMLPAIGYGYHHSLDAFARSLCVVSATMLTALILVLAPVTWQMYLWMRYGQSMEGELHWFLTLLALEVRPQGDETSDRVSTSSGEDSRLRVESIISLVDDDDSDDGAIIIPTKTPLLDLENSQRRRSVSQASPQAIRAFRLENALDTILGRPLLSFFAIKDNFQTKFLPRDNKGRRVLLVSMNNVNRKGLLSHNVSGFNVMRYFLYLWEFMWSYQDMQEGVSESQLVLIIDCSKWPYFKWFSIECQILIQLLNKTCRYYPGRLGRIIFVRNKFSLGLYGKLCRQGLDADVRDIIETAESLAPFIESGAADDTLSKDERYLHDFVTSVLATHANVAVPSFTPRELEQAARFTTTGSLKVDDQEASVDAIGTRAVMLPANIDTMTWQTVMDGNGLTVWKSNDPNAPSLQGKTYQSDSRAAQWRGRYVMKATDAERVIDLLQDTKSSSFWMEDTDKLVLLDKLSRQEDVCFWSRRVPFMNFSLSGHRDGRHGLDHAQKNAYFHCVMRRIVDVKTTEGSNNRTATLMWKTTSAQNFVVNRPPPSADTHHNGVQWRKLEDPYVSACFVVEENANDKTVTLNFWFQSFSPPTNPKQDTTIAHLIAHKFQALDALAAQPAKI